MMKTLLVAAFFALSATAAFAGWFPTGINMFGTEDVEAGTVCKVKEIVVLAQSAEDCVTIGGEATHTLTHSAVPVAK